MGWAAKHIPKIGFGTYQVKPDLAGKAIRQALEVGYRHIDCAYRYQNEFEIGQSISQAIEDHICKREDIFITSKIWPTHLYPHKINLAIENSLFDLQTDYLDLYLIHHPHRVDDKGKIELWKAKWMAEIWECMENLVSEGKVRAIGVSNFSIKKLEALLKTAKIWPVVNQVENHLYFQQPKLKRFLDAKGIALQSYSPLGSPNNPARKEDLPEIFDDRTVMEIAVKWNCTIAQICIAFQILRNNIVIPKSVSYQRIKENFGALNTKIHPLDMDRLESLDMNIRFFTPRFLSPYSNDPQFWDDEYDKKYYTKNLIT